MGTSIKRDLPNNEYQATVGANNPSASNVFTTENDVQAGYAINVNLDPVLDNTVTDPTTLTPDFGDSYIVAVGAVLGDWFGQDNNIATWDGEAWQFYIPSSGDITTVLTGVNAGSIYEYTTSWNVISAIASNSSPFYLAGSTTDAGGNKTSTIARTGPVTLGSNSGSLGTSPLTVRGNASIENVNTRWRLGFANATTLNNWFRLATFSVPNNSSKNYQILVNISAAAPNAFVSAILHITISKNNGATGKSVCSVVNISGPGISGAGFENFRLEDSNFQFRKYESINAGGTVYRLYYSPTILGSSMSVTVLNNNGGGTSGSVGILWNNTYLGAAIEAPGLGGATDNEAIFNYSGQKTNISAIVDPTVSNDYTEQYTTGSLWYNTANNTVWTCLDNTGAAAIWKQITPFDGALDNIITSSTQFSKTLAAPVNLPNGTTANGFEFFLNTDKVTGGTTSYNEYDLSWGRRLTLTGTSGTANVNILAVNYPLTFNTSLNQTAENFVTANQATLSALGIQVFNVSGVLRFGSLTQTDLTTITITNTSGTLNGTLNTAINDHIVVPYNGTPYENLRIQHNFRVNFGLAVGSTQTLALSLRRWSNDTIIGSEIPVFRNADVSGQQFNFVSYTAGGLDPFVTGGFYFALRNDSGTSVMDIEGAIGILIQNYFQKPINF